MTTVTAHVPVVPARNDADQPFAGSVDIDLVARARGGDFQAWNALLDRYDPLISSICRKYRLGRADTDDVSQSVWLRLVDQLDKIRDPAALPGWLATTVRRECGRVVRAAHGPHAVVFALDAENLPDAQAEAAEQELLAAERHEALREAFTHLPSACQRLVAELTAAREALPPELRQNPGHDFPYRADRGVPQRLVAGSGRCGPGTHGAAPDRPAKPVGTRANV